MESVERLHQMHSNKDKTVIGLYYPNGVFQEDNTNRGISIIADHIRYLELCNKITDSGLGSVRGFTHPGYSSFLLISTPDKAFDCYRLAQEALSQFHIRHNYDPEYLGEWILDRSSHYRRVPVRLETQYYQKRTPNTPLAKSLYADIAAIPSAEEIERWDAMYANRIAVVTSGAVTEPLGMLNSNPYNTSCLPKLCPERLEIPRHIPWNYANMIVSIPCDMAASQALVFDALCQWLTPRLRAAINCVGGKLLSAEFRCDYVNEYRFIIRCRRGTEKHICGKIAEIIRTGNPESKKEISAVRAGVQEFYATIYSDCEEWNRFCGYNAISGSNYQPQQMMDRAVYDRIITAASLKQALDQMISQLDQFSVFVSPLR